jgi:hypothetical protein
MNVLKHFMVVLLLSSLYPSLAHCSPNITEKILIVGDWGNRDGEFGRETLGKTELGYVFDIQLYKGNIYIFDPMNNRIQVFGLNGQFIRKIPLSFDWIKQGLTYRFAILNGNFFAVIARPPYYSMMNDDIYKISPDGKILLKFGAQQLNIKAEQYFADISSDEQAGHVTCAIGGAGKSAIYDFEGKFIKFTQIPDLDHFSRRDKDGTLYRIRSISDRKNNFAITTTIQIDNKDNNIKLQHQANTDIQYVKKGEPIKINYHGNFIESFAVSTDGDIYHLIALDDGIVLRRISWQSK